MATLVEPTPAVVWSCPVTSNEKFLLRENEDGSILLQPARIVTEAQHEYNESPDLQELLALAARSKTVRRARNRRAG